MDHVAFRCTLGHVLVGLFLAALRIDVVAAGEIGVNGAVHVIARAPREGVHVEAALGWHTVRVREVLGVTEEEFQVAL